MTERQRHHIVQDELLESATLILPPGVVGVDAGMTLTKVARGTARGIELASRETRAAMPFDGRAVAPDASRIGVTGARAGDVSGDARAMPVQEIDAAARGLVAMLAAAERLGDGEFVMALLGTGTAFAAVRGGKATHLGGTPLGGGSFTGIVRRVDATLSYAEMIGGAERGDRRRVDAMIADIYPEGIGRIGPDLTAAHLAKQGDASMDDFLAGLLNLHGENIAQIGASRAIMANIRRIVLAGGFAHGNPALVTSISTMATLFGVAVELAPSPGFAGAIGAALVAAEAT